MKLTKNNKPKAKPAAVKSLKPAKAAVKPTVKPTVKPAAKTVLKTAVKAVVKAAAKTSAKKTAPARREITTELVASRAYILWDKAGRPQGRDVEYWLQAESQLKQNTQSFAA